MCVCVVVQVRGAGHHKPGALLYLCQIFLPTDLLNCSHLTVSPLNHHDLQIRNTLHTISLLFANSKHFTSAVQGGVIFLIKGLDILKQGKNELFVNIALINDQLDIGKCR